MCYNCHALTDNYRNKNRNKKNEDQIIREKKKFVPEEEYVEVLQKSKSMFDAIKKLGLIPAGGNYARAKYLVEKYNITFDNNDNNKNENN